jgi:hypothetical protein
VYRCCEQAKNEKKINNIDFGNYLALFLWTKPSNSKTEKVAIKSEIEVSIKNNNIQSQNPDLERFIYTDTTYASSSGKGITIQNSLPKGGSIEPNGTQYLDPTGKSYAFAVFWTRIINETNTALELNINFPADSFANFTPPDSYLKLLLPLFMQQPAYQVLLFLLLTPLLIFVIQPKDADRAWLIAVYTFFVFLLVNAGLLWFDDSPWHYFFYSIGFALVYLLLIAIIMPGLLKVLRLESSGESAMAFLIVIYQPFALLLVMLVKWIVTQWF